MVRRLLLVAVMRCAAHPVLLLLAAAGVVGVAVLGWYELLLPVAAWTVFGVAGALVRRGSLVGLPVRPADEPELAALVSGVAEQLGFRAPIALRVVPDGDASLSRTRLRGTPAYGLALGLPFLEHLDRAQLTAVVAHELAHEQHASDRLHHALLNARADLAASRFHRVRLPAPLLVGLLSLTDDEALGAELDADRDSVRVAGTAAVASALTRTVELQAAFDVLALGWVERAGERGERPDDLYDALATALQDRCVQARLRRLVERQQARPDEPGTTHPSAAARTAALPDVAVTVTGGPVPLRTREALAARCVEALSEGYADEPAPVRVLDGDEALLHDDVGGLLDDLREATGSPGTAAAMTAVLDGIAEGSWRGLAEQFAPPLEEDEREAELRLGWAQLLGAVLSHGLRSAGWRTASPWTRSVLLAPDGREVWLPEAVEEALTSGDVTELRGLLATARYEEAA